MEDLLREYKRRIEQHEQEIKDCTKEIREIRRGHDSYQSVEEWANDRKLAETKRNLYFQVIKDILSLQS